MNKMILGVMLLLSGTPVFAQSAPSDVEAPRHHFVDKVSAKLGLDAGASQRLQATFDKFRAQSMPLHHDARLTAETLREELKSGRADQTKVKQLTDQLSADRQQLQSIRAARMAEVKSQLTPEQYATLLTLKSERHGRHHRHDQGRQ